MSCCRPNQWTPPERRFTSGPPGAGIRCANTSSTDRFITSGRRPPRLGDPPPDRTAKASFVAVEYDEYGAGRGTHLHQSSSAIFLTPPASIRRVSATSMSSSASRGCGRSDVHAGIPPKFCTAPQSGVSQRREMTSPPGSRGWWRRSTIRAPDPSLSFYAEHVEATPCTNRWCAVVSSTICSHVTVGSNVTSSSACGRSGWSRTAWPTTS